MPRKFKSKRPETPEISAESVLDGIEDGPYKDTVQSVLNDFQEKAENERARLSKMIQDDVATKENMFAVIKGNIPKHLLQMNFYRYMEMVEGESTLSVRESFQARVDNVCDFGNAATRANTHKKTGPKQTSTAIKKIKSASTADGDQANGANSESQTVAVSATISVSGVRRSLRKGSKPAARMLMDAQNSKCRSNNVFTPKFDPRLPITPAHGLRKPQAGEKVVLMSQAGSPLATDFQKTRRTPAILLPQRDGKSIAISSDTKLDNLNIDNETKESLRFIQQKLSSIVKVPISKCD